MPVFLFMYVEVPVGPAGGMRQNPIQPRDATKSGSCEMIVLVHTTEMRRKRFQSSFRLTKKTNVHTDF